mgnify:CR=1 FL=1
MSRSTSAFHSSEGIGSAPSETQSRNASEGTNASDGQPAQNGSSSETGSESSSGSAAQSSRAPASAREPEDYAFVIERKKVLAYGAWAEEGDFMVVTRLAAVSMALFHLYTALTGPMNTQNAIHLLLPGK